MVRFHWHVEQGLSAYMPPDGISLQKDSKVQQASCEIEVGAQAFAFMLANRLWQNSIGGLF